MVIPLDLEWGYICRIPLLELLEKEVNLQIIFISLTMDLFCIQDFNSYIK